MKSPARRRCATLSPLSFAVALALSAVACGGKVVVDGNGGEGGAGGAATTTVTTGSTSTVTTSTSTTTSSSSSSSSSSGMGGAPPIPPLVEVDYGSVTPGTPMPFDVPAGMLGFTAIATTPQPFAAVGFETLAAPNGKALVTDYGYPGTYSAFYNYGIGVVAEPVTSDAEAMPPMAGTWNLTVGSPEGANIAPHVSVWLRQTLDGQFHGGVIDVNLFVVAGVADTSYLTDTVTQAFTGWVGLDIGTINVLPLDDSYYQVDDGNFFQALEETQGAPGKPALNILCVGYLGGSLEGAAGVTPGAPSMPLIHGTHQSGLFWMVLQDTFFDPIIVQHETGHLAGLMHTSEFDAGVGDALSDTPFCPDVMATGGGCPDYDNLMFPTGGDGSAVLTLQQQRVIAGSVLYRGRVEEGGAPAAPLDQLDQGGAGSPEGRGIDSSPTGRGARAALARRGATRAARHEWAHGLSAQATAQLTGVGCPGRGAGYFDILRGLGADDPATLLAIGTDPAAPTLARVRALAAVGHTAPSVEALDALAAVASTEGVPAQLRLGALDGLAAASGGRAEALTRSLLAADDRFVRAAAAHRTAAAR